MKMWSVTGNSVMEGELKGRSTEVRRAKYVWSLLVVMVGDEIDLEGNASGI